MERNSEWWYCIEMLYWEREREREQRKTLVSKRKNPRSGKGMCFFFRETWKCETDVYTLRWQSALTLDLLFQVHFFPSLPVSQRRALTIPFLTWYLRTDLIPVERSLSRERERGREELKRVFLPFYGQLAERESSFLACCPPRVEEVCSPKSSVYLAILVMNWF